MPSFLSSLRRKSRADIKIEKPGSSAKHGAVHGNGQTNGHTTNGTVSRRKSSSTLASSGTTPATSTSENGSIQPKAMKNGTPPLPTSNPRRPTINSTKRYSMNVSINNNLESIITDSKVQGLASVPTNGSQMSINPSSLLAPRVLSVVDGSWVLIFTPKY